MIREDREVLERIEGHLSDIVTTLGSMDRNLEVLREIAHITSACILGFNPLEGTAYDGDDLVRDEDDPEEE